MPTTLPVPRDNLKLSKSTLSLDKYVEPAQKEIAIDLRKAKKKSGVKQSVLPKDSKIDLNQTLNQVKHHLLYNYIANSFGENDKNKIDFDRILKKIEDIKDDEIKGLMERNEKCRNILIIGTGASYDAYKPIPLGKQLIDLFEKEYIDPIKNIEHLKDKYDTLIGEIAELNKHGLDFENFLSILSKYFVDPKSLREKITEYTGYRHLPSLFCEVAAHLLKHSFFDAIINFNFDELLDQAIEEELHNSNYKYVLSDGHCVQLDELLVDGRLKTPIYIKPHGTFSHKASLRFTKRHYLDLPSDIENMLEALISGYRGKKYYHESEEQDKSIKRVNLYFVGFNLESVDLNRIINKKLPGRSKIYHFGYSLEEYKLEKLRSKDYLPDFFGRARAAAQKDNDAYQFVPMKYFEKDPSCKQPGALGELFSVLWRNIYNSFEKVYMPRSIGRHELISYLFQNSVHNMEAREESEERKLLKEKFDENPNYLRDRVLVEIALELVRGNGMIDVVDVLNDDRRVGQYYKLFRKACREKSREVQKKHSFFELLNEFTSKHGSKDIYEKEEFHSTYNIFKIEADENFTSKKIRDKHLKDAWKDVKFAAKIDDPNNGIAEEKTIEECMIKCFEYFLNMNNATITGEKKDTTKNLVILFRLLTSKLLSDTFKIDLVKKFDKSACNGLIWTDVKSKSEYELSVIYEIFRLFTKSAGSHYYFIRPNYSDSKNYNWESFNRSKLIHTNLALVYEFHEMFFKRNWDTLFCVLEVGEIIRYTLDYMIGKSTVNKDFKKTLKQIADGQKKVILICCREAVSQIHGSSHQSIPELAETHMKFIFRADEGSNNSVDMPQSVGQSQNQNTPKDNFKLRENSVDVVLLPFLLHNHHSIIFSRFNRQTEGGYDSSAEFKGISLSLSKDSNKLNEKVANITSLGSLYMYRRGLSNSINPLYIGIDPKDVHSPYLANDFQKLIALFFTYCIRAFKFSQEHNTHLPENGWILKRFFEENKTMVNSMESDASKFNPLRDQFLKEIYESQNNLDESKK